jgi:hypothetical protein
MTQVQTLKWRSVVELRVICTVHVTYELITPFVKRTTLSILSCAATEPFSIRKIFLVDIGAAGIWRKLTVLSGLDVKEWVSVAQGSAAGVSDHSQASRHARRAAGQRAGGLQENFCPEGWAPWHAPCDPSTQLRPSSSPKRVSGRS